ncbi:MAG: tRNA-dihydrouridine synthase family protein [Lachnospiraceae bacterium]|nr:tRNA-dihydrouridine synthase family protein [Lachnospiraceae bacterium]
MIRLSFAPMEGVTGPVFRRVFKEVFGGVDTFYTPFLSANQNHSFKKREKREYLPYDPMLVPQVMAADPLDFVWAAKLLKDAGYSEVNLNLGCPMATVVSRKRGAGLLKDTEVLRRFLDAVFSQEGLPDISVKTRTGFETSEQAAQLGKLYAAFPFCEVVIHPRAREEFYIGRADIEAFKLMRAELDCPVCYNGDIRTTGDIERLKTDPGGVDHFMIGRGLLADPALALKIKGVCETEDRRRVYDFLNRLWDAYMGELSGERDVLFKMKELWYYLEWHYPEEAELIGRIRKSRSAAEYRSLTMQVLNR